MTPETSVSGQWTLEVDRVTDRQVANRGALERLGHGVHSKPFVAPLDDGQTATVDGHRGTKSHVV